MYMEIENTGLNINFMNYFVNKNFMNLLSQRIKKFTQNNKNGSSTCK
jgi:hypothetical protein